MKFTQAIKMALSSILSNKMRSFLTMLGIIIGIMSVIVLIALGQGTKQQVSSQIESLGTNLVTVNITGNRNKGISDAEIATLKTQSGIKEIAPTITSNVNAKVGTNSVSTSVEASTPEYEEIRDVHAQSGRFLAPSDVDYRLNVMLIGVNVVDELFPNHRSYDEVVGQTVSLNGANFKIVGVLESKGSSMSGSSDDRVVIPISTAQRFLKSKDIKTFYVEATSADKVNDAVNNLTDFLLKKYNNDTNSFRVFNQTQLLSTVTATTDNLTMMLGGIAAISLIVGGIGIMNIMLVSVTERTREIGLRKSIGARRRDILVQFLIEAVFISGVGGIVGILFGYLGSQALSKAVKMTLVISPSVVGMAVGFAAAVGIVFGLYPANKASKLSPIDALRYE